MFIEVLTYLLSRTAEINPSGKKSFQKLVYFLQEFNVPLQFKYTMYFYGPYSKSLSESLDEMSFEGIIQYEPKGHTVFVKPGIAAKFVLEESTDTIELFKSNIDFIVSKLAMKTASQLELLATAHYILKNNCEINSDDDVVDEISRLKGDKFQRQQTLETIQELRSLELSRK